MRINEPYEFSAWCVIELGPWLSIAGIQFLASAFRNRGAGRKPEAIILKDVKGEKNKTKKPNIHSLIRKSPFIALLNFIDSNLLRNRSCTEFLQHQLMQCF